MPPILKRYFPILDWGQSYTKSAFSNDAMAAVIVTIMLIPQSLAYALLAGLPAQIGLYASMLPLIGYAIFGTSRALAVGPVAVVSLMSVAAIGNLGLTSAQAFLEASIVLALISGIFLVIMGLFKLGFLANFLSHPVISGFITASGIIIASSQLKHILGVDASGHNLLEVILSLITHIEQINYYTVILGVCSVAFLFWVRKGLKPLLLSLKVSPGLAGVATKVGPVAVVIVTTLSVYLFTLQDSGVKIVGEIPTGLPALQVPGFDMDLWQSLLMPAILISIVGFVESVSVAQTLAAKKRQTIHPNQELIGLGASNIASAVSGGYSVTGGFARSVVNFDAGAETPAAGAFTAIGIALATLFLTPYLYFLPKAALAATIIVAVLSLVDLSALKRTWTYSKSDFAAMAITIVLTLAMGVELGIVAGVSLSLAIYLYRTSKPHYAIVGRVPETEHFRNIKRHDVICAPEILTIRVDESLYFANARYLEDIVYQHIADQPKTKHVILMCPAVNLIDASAFESLEAINHRLKDAGVSFNLSEVKGPVMDRLQKTDFVEHLNGKIYLSQFEAFQDLAPEKAA